MAKKILKPFGLGGKKKAPAEPKGPIVTPLSADDLKLKRVKGAGRLPANFATIMSQALGTSGKLGG